MHIWLTLLPLCAPAALLSAAAVARLQPGPRPHAVVWACRFSASAALAIAVVAGAFAVIRGPLTSPLIGVAEVGLSVRIDALSTIMFGLVAFVGWIVLRFSRNYLDGDPHHGRFLGAMSLTLAVVMLLVLSGNLFQLVAAWIATSLALQRLLLFYGNRPGAIVAARKKFIVARVGDVCLIAAAILLAHGFGTTDIGELLQRAGDARAAASIPLATQIAALLLAIAALFKSAQFPTHGWLAEVMEAPTPVSALLHAGIINAGGFLVIRLADVMLLYAPSMHLLTLVGGVTALIASVVMITQTNIKTMLAYSTVAQMGFMLLECGVGAFSFAVLHIVAHSFYKAHAFLSSGSTIEASRLCWTPPTPVRRHPFQLLVSVLAAVTIFACVAALLGVSFSEKPVMLPLGAVLVMALVHLLLHLSPAPWDGYSAGRTILSAVAVAAAYVVLERSAESLFASSLPSDLPDDMLTWIILAVLISLFAVVTLFQLIMSDGPHSPLGCAVYVHAKNGFYANAFVNRVVGDVRFDDRSLAKEIP